MNFIIKLEVYPFEIMFSLGDSDKKLKNILRKKLTKEAFAYAYKDDFLLGFNKNSEQAGHTLFLGKHSQTIVRLGKKPSRGVVAHEIFHAIMMIMNNLKMPLCFKNDEAYAYLIGYVTDKFYEKIKCRRKKNIYSTYSL